MKLKSTLLSALVILSSVVFANNDINAFVSPTAVCSGDTMTVIIVPTDSFAAGNIYSLSLVKESDLSHVSIGQIAGRYIDTFTFVVPQVSQNGNDFDVAVTASADGTLGGTINTFTVHNRITATLQFPQPSYCTYTQSIPLSGGSPAGGVYSGTYVQNNSFLTSQSGVGTFDVYYNIPDTLGCTTGDTAAITIITCASPSVSVLVSPAALCPGGVMNINIQTSDVLASDNVFTVQLSDATGSFASPTVLALDTDATSNTIQIPTPTEAAGNLYQVRVIASDPFTNGVPVNVTFKATAASPIIKLNADSALSLCTRDSFKLKVDSLRGIVYQWTFNGSPLNVSKYTYTAKDSGLYVVHFTDTTSSGCSSGADSLFIGIYPYPAKPAISPNTTIDYCGIGSVALSTPVNNAVTFQWDNHSHDISGATQNTYSATATGIYLVKAVSTHGCATKSDSVHIFIHPNPVVTFNIASDTFCLHASPIQLSGGNPAGAGGYYSGTDVLNNAIFDQASSGLGSFKVYYTFIDSIGCHSTDSSQIHIYDCTIVSGINEITAQHSFEMFPNPASAQIHISTLAADNCRMKVFNLIGQEVSTQQFSQQLTYSVANLPAGVYMVEVSDISNSWKTVKRLVIQ